MEAAIHTSKAAAEDSSTASYSKELGAVVIIVDDIFVAVLMVTESSFKKTVRTRMLLMLSTLWAAFLMTDRATFLAVWTALWGTAETTFQGN